MSIKELVNALRPVSDRWYELGIQFGLTTNELDGIKQGKPHNSVNEWMVDVFDMTLQRNPEFGWSDVIQALIKIDEALLAESIQREHYPQREESNDHSNYLCNRENEYTKCISVKT